MDHHYWTLIRTTYIPQEDDIGNYLRVTATYDDELGPDKTAKQVSDSVVLEEEATNQLPAFELDSDTATRSVRENTPASVDIGDPFTATDDDDVAHTDLLSGRTGWCVV